MQEIARCARLRDSEKPAIPPQRPAPLLRPGSRTKNIDAHNTVSQDAYAIDAVVSAEQMEFEPAVTQEQLSESSRGMAMETGPG